VGVLTLCEGDCVVLDCGGILCERLMTFRRRGLREA
jgi:hypothetical protein